jgi:hypothetical protein
MGSDEKKWLYVSTMSSHERQLIKGSCVQYEKEKVEKKHLMVLLCKYEAV